MSVCVCACVRVCVCGVAGRLSVLSSAVVVVVVVIAVAGKRAARPALAALLCVIDHFISEPVSLAAHQRSRSSDGGCAARGLFLPLSRRTQSHSAAATRCYRRRNSNAPTLRPPPPPPPPTLPPSCDHPAL